MSPRANIPSAFSLPSSNVTRQSTRSDTRTLRPLALLLLTFWATANAHGGSLTLHAGAQYNASGNGSSGNGACHQGWAACNVWHHDQAVTGQYRQAAMDCYSSLGRALDLEDEAFDLNQRLRGTTEPEHGRLAQDMNRKLRARGVQLNVHQQCIAKWFADHDLAPPADLAERRAPAPATSPVPRDHFASLGGATWAQKLDQALGKIPYLHETDRFLARISDYDMTKPHTGARIMAESVGNLLGEAGFSYLIRGAKTLIAKGASRLADQAASGAAVAARKMENAAGRVAHTAAQPAEAAGGTLGGRTGGGMTGSNGAGSAFGSPARDALLEHGPPPGPEALVNPPSGTARNRLLEQHGPPPGSGGRARAGPARDTLLERHGPPPGAGVGELMHPEHIWQAQLPPGTRLSPVLMRTPRPVYLQQSTHSCVLACSRMISETHLGHALPEEWLAEVAKNTKLATEHAHAAAYVPGEGTWNDRMQEVLWHAGVPSRFETNVTIGELRAATANGAPAMVSLGLPGGGHAVVVDEIVDTARGTWVVYRDPANLNLLSPQARANAIRAGFTNAPAVPLSDFMKSYRGMALLTDHP